MASFCLWHLRTPTKLWDVMTPKLKISSLQYCCDIMFCAHNSVQLNDMAIPLCKALTDGFISSMTPKNSDQVTGTLWPKNWKFHHYNGAAMSHFVLITRWILDLTTCAIPLCKALTNGFILSMTPKNSDQWLHFVYDTQELRPSYGTLWPKTENFIITILLRYLVLCS